MRFKRTTIAVIGTVLMFALSACASNSSDSEPVAHESNSSEGKETDIELAGEAGTADISIPDGAYAASGNLLFPIPEGWNELEPLTEGKLGKDITTSGSVEYPGDAQGDAATYLEVLKAAGFNAYTYAPGELTNKASLAAEGFIDGTEYFAMLNFDEHADGFQRVSITIVEED